MKFASMKRFFVRNVPLRDFLKKQKFLLSFSSIRPKYREVRKKYGAVFADRCLEECMLVKEVVANLEVGSIDVFLDVGANVGQTLIGARWALGSHVKLFGYEPVKHIYEEVLRRVAGDENTKVFHAALGAEEGEVEINVSRSGPFSQASSIKAFSSIYKQEFPLQDNTVIEKVPLKTLDQMLDLNEIQETDNVYLHIDTEGYEYEVLSGGARLLRTTVKAINMEVTFGLFMGQLSFYQVIDILRENFEFRGGITGITKNAAGRYLYQDVLFVRK